MAFCCSKDSCGCDPLIDVKIAKSWPFQEAKRILERLEKRASSKGYALFETGYGPSGLPHIGTFGEVARTSMVRHAFEQLSNIPTRLFCFSDDMDGLRKIPDNVPNKDMLQTHIYKPLTQVPDPFEKFPSFGEHNNAMLRQFLDSFGFAYEFQSSTDWYKSGRFNEVLQLILERYDAVMEIMLPSLRSERQSTYSAFLPVCKKTGHVLQVPLLERNVSKGTIVYADPHTGEKVEASIFDGSCKLQWKVDWAARWRAFDVDYEMSGKDLIDSVKLSTQICKVLGGEPPVCLTYELFLDDKGQKISKSKGNGLTIDEWLKYAPHESLSYFMYQNPGRAKRLYFDVIPRHVDEYYGMLQKYVPQTPQEKIDNPVWHIHSGNPPKAETPLTFTILLNLASVCHSEDPSKLWGFVSRYQIGATPESLPELDRLIHYAIAYYHDFVKPAKAYRNPTSQEKEAIEDLSKNLQEQPLDASSETLQNIVFEIGKKHGFSELRQWFGTLYEVLLGQKEGPRMGSFIALYGIKETINLIQEKLK